MLVLTRLVGESVYINNNIKVTVVEIRNGKIRLGIEAPNDTSIVREELLPKQKGGSTDKQTD